MMTPTDVKNLMVTSNSEEEWNANCDKVKQRCGGYPSFWFSVIIASGFADQVMSKFGKSATIEIQSLRIRPGLTEEEENILNQHSDQNNELIMAAVSMVTLHRFENQELSALNLAVQLQGKVPKENLAFDKALDYKLIREDGSVYDLNALKRACACEVNARVEAGTFN